MLRLKLHTHSSVGLQVSEVFSKQLRLLLVHYVMIDTDTHDILNFSFATGLGSSSVLLFNNKCACVLPHVFSTVLTLLLRGVVIPENEVLDKEDLGTDEAGALSVVTPYSGDLSFHYATNGLVPEESVGYFYISSTETFSNGSRIIRLRRRRDEEQSTSQEGVWRCSVPSDANGGRRNIYFGLYSRCRL